MLWPNTLTLHKVNGSAGGWDTTHEEAFLEEYRGAALKWAAYACLAGALLFGAFFSIAWLSQPWSVAQFVRIGLSVFLLALGAALWAHRGVTLKNYVCIATTGSAIALAGTILILALPGQSAQTVAFQSAPSFIFGLFLHYSFLRLPMWTAAKVGWGMSVLAVVWAPAAINGGDTIRHAIYLSFANVFGLIICYLIETRERDLFFQRRQAESARALARERQRAAEEADHQKTRLIAAVSHDLRQPMMAAVAYLEILRRRIDAGDLTGAREHFGRTQAAVEILGTTLDHLLTAARYDSGTEPLRLELVELAPLLRDLYDVYSPEAAGRGLTLRIRVPKRRLVLETDRRSLHRVLSNLISNAIKFSRCEEGRGCTVFVRSRIRSQRCEIAVFDTGVGIAAEDFDDIWKPYVQLNNVERDRERGLGLGLFLVRRIVEQLPRHSLEMQSQVQKGSKFAVSMPAAWIESDVADWADEVYDGPHDNLGPLDGAYVLLVEDDLDARVSITRLLEEWGVVVTSGATVAEVLRCHADVDLLVDAVVCDYSLGGGANGIQAIAEINEMLGYSPRSILITGEANIEELQASAARDTSVLQKPFRIDAFSRLLLDLVAYARDFERG
jgi:signal transduction histidine kinase